MRLKVVSPEISTSHWASERCQRVGFPGDDGTVAAKEVLECWTALWANLLASYSTVGGNVKFTVQCSCMGAGEIAGQKKVLSCWPDTKCGADSWSTSSTICLVSIRSALTATLIERYPGLILHVVISTRLPQMTVDCSHFDFDSRFEAVTTSLGFWISVYTIIRFLMSC